MKVSQFSNVKLIQEALTDKFPFFAKVIDKRASEFGDHWLDTFNEELEVFFGDDISRLNAAVKGYGHFALDAMKLQLKFDKTRRYESKSYAEVSQAVYMNRSYMFDLYLPGILLSQYLWPHHYRQLRFFHEKFASIVRERSFKSFYDVGTGTGFYSKETLRAIPAIRGHGYDISPFSLEHTDLMLERWGLTGRYVSERRDILSDVPKEQTDCIVNVEVLEHLEDPLRFLEGLLNLLRPGGIGFITAAINAPNADHIYLYRSLDEVCAQMEMAGFSVLESVEHVGYVPKPGASAPSNGICIVTTGDEG